MTARLKPIRKRGTGCYSAAPYAQENLQRRARSKRGDRLLANCMRTDIERKMIGDCKYGKVKCVGRLGRPLRQCRILPAAAIDTWPGRDISRITWPIWNRLVAARRFGRDRIRPVLVRESTARSWRQSQNQACRSGQEEMEKRIHFNGLYASWSKRVRSLKKILRKGGKRRGLDSWKQEPQREHGRLRQK
jgi:hypothetical protein